MVMLELCCRYFIVKLCSFMLKLLLLKEWHQPALFLVALFVSLHYPADCNLLRNFKKPPTAKSHLTIDGLSDHPETFSLFAAHFFSRPHWFPLSFNGRDGGRAPVKSGGTGVLHEAKRDPFGPVVNEEVMQRPDSPFPRPFSPIFLPPSPFVPTLWLTSE